MSKTTNVKARVTKGYPFYYQEFGLVIKSEFSEVPDSDWLREQEAAGLIEIETKNNKAASTKQSTGTEG